MILIEAYLNTLIKMTKIMSIYTESRSTVFEVKSNRL